MKSKKEKDKIDKSKSCFWVWAKRHIETDYDIYIIETTKTSILKQKQLEGIPHWNKYNKNGDLICTHIKTIKGSPEQKYIFKELGLKLKDRVMFDK